ncbi:MAG: hypothetical protein WAT70_05780 [Rhizobiaceae bacterium]
MIAIRRAAPDPFVPIPSTRTRHRELMRLCARIGYSPPSLA